MHALLLLVLSVTPDAHAVSDAAHGFSFVVPVGYATVPAPNAWYSYARGTVGEGRFALLTVSGLGGTISEGSKLDPAIVEDAAKKSAAAGGVTVSDFRYARVKWREYELDEVFSRAAGNGLEAVSFTAQVPLKREAIQLVLIGSAADEAGLQREFREVLASVQGETSWEAEHDRQAGARAGRLVGLALPLLGLLTWLLVRKKRT